MNELKKWLNIINEQDIQKFYDKGKSLKKIPKNLNTKAIKIIDNYNPNIKKQNIKQNIFEFKYFKFVFATVTSLIIIIFTLFLFIKTIPEYKAKTQIKTNIFSYTGDYKIERLTEVYKKTSSIKNNDIIQTEKNSIVSVSIGNKTTLNIFELSEIKFIELRKNKNNEISRFFLNRGKIECFVNLPTRESIFKIYTDISTISVKGTHFILNVNEDKSINLYVYKGIVEASNLIKQSEILKNLKIESDIYQVLQKLINQNIQVKQNDFIIIQNDMIKKLNNDFNLLIDRIKNNSKKDKDIIDEIHKIESTFSNLLVTQKEIEKLKVDDVINITTDDAISDKSEIKLIGNKFIFVYQWAKNQSLDQKIEILKKQITSEIKNPLIYSISYKSLDIYYSKVNNIIFFFTAKTLENNLELKKYTGISLTDMKKQLQSKKSQIIKIIYNNKSIVIFYGEDENDLIKVISKYK